jgi:hypothetical protein
LSCWGRIQISKEIILEVLGFRHVCVFQGMKQESGERLGLGSRGEPKHLQKTSLVTPRGGKIICLGVECSFYRQYRYAGLFTDTPWVTW